MAAAGGAPASQDKASDAAQQVAQRQQPARQQTREPQSQTQTPVQQPREPAVKRGDLVKPGPGVVQPRVTRRARPVYPPVAARLNREASVDVQVLVDENGKVVDAMISGEKQRFGFDEAALDAARKSVFAPANKDGVAVKMWTTIRFEFRR
jgi:TonB family protein